MDDSTYGNQIFSETCDSGADGFALCTYEQCFSTLAADNPHTFVATEASTPSNQFYWKISDGWLESASLSTVIEIDFSVGLVRCIIYFCSAFSF